MPDLHPLLFGAATDPVDITKGELFRAQSQRVTKQRVLTTVTDNTITIENVTTGAFYDGRGFTSDTPVVLAMRLADSGSDVLDTHRHALYEFFLRPNPGGKVGPGDIIEAHVRIRFLSVTIIRIRYLDPRDFPLADRRFPRRRKIPFTAVQDARRTK